MTLLDFLVAAVVVGDGVVVVCAIVVVCVVVVVPFTSPCLQIPQYLAQLASAHSLYC